MCRTFLSLVILACAGGLARGQSAPESTTPSLAQCAAVSEPAGQEPAAQEPAGQVPLHLAEEHDPEPEDEPARRPDRFWFRTEYMLWWIRSATFPVLVTSGSASDPRPGALGQPGTSILYGGSGINFQDRNGGRFTAGYYFDDEHTFGIDGGYFFLVGRAIGESFTSNGSPVLAQPFYNVNAGSPDALLTAFPGILQGSITVAAPSFFESAEINLSAALRQTEQFRLEGLAGFRYLGLNEGLHISSNSLVSLAPNYQNLGIPFDGNTIVIEDLFDTRNHFYGGQLGTRAEYRSNRLSLGLVMKVGLGVSNEVVAIRGRTSIDTQPATVNNAGFLAVSSNGGEFSRDRFAVVPEIGLNFGFQLTNRLKIVAGYSFLYWSSVVRPGDFVDTSINTNLVPASLTGSAGGPAQPAFAWQNSHFYAHGANFGLEFRY